MIQKPTWPQLSQFFALLKSIQHIILHRKRIFEYIFYEVIILNLTYLGYGLLIGPAICVIGGIIWCCLVVNDYI